MHMQKLILDVMPFVDIYELTKIFIFLKELIVKLSKLDEEGSVSGEG